MQTIFSLHTDAGASETWTGMVQHRYLPLSYRPDFRIDRIRVDERKPV